MVWNASELRNFKTFWLLIKKRIFFKNFMIFKNFKNENENPVAPAIPKIHQASGGIFGRSSRGDTPYRGGGKFSQNLDYFFATRVTHEQK